MEALEQCQTVLFHMPKQSPMYGVLSSIQMFYKPIHPYVSIFFCILGTLCNFCNIVVLTRRQMRTPVNMILTAMACCDTVVLFSNLIFTTHFTFIAFDKCVPEKWSYGWALFLIAHAHLSLVGHSSSIWLSVMLAFIRYVTLRQRGKANAPVVSLKHSYIAIASVLVCVSLINTPNFMTYEISIQRLDRTCKKEQIPDPSLYGADAFVPGVSKYALYADCLIFRMAFWISGTIFKFLPCIFLTILVSLLTRILKEVRENKNRLLGNRHYNNTGSFVPSDQSSAHQPSQYQTEYTVISSPTQAITSSEFTRSSSPVVIRQNFNSATLKQKENGKLQTNTTGDGKELNAFSHRIVVTAPSDSATNYSLTAAQNGSLERFSATPSPTPSYFKSSPSTNHQKKNQSIRRRKSETGTTSRTDRTTRMLLFIVCVFLVTELPQGIMAVLSGMFSEEFRHYVYNSMGDILDLLSLCNACTSFVIYCSMSVQFRNEFRRVFFPKHMKCWISLVSTSERQYCQQCHRLVSSFPNSNTGRGSTGGLIKRICRRRYCSCPNESGTRLWEPSTELVIRTKSKNVRDFDTDKLLKPSPMGTEASPTSYRANCNGFSKATKHSGKKTTRRSSESSDEHLLTEQEDSLIVQIPSQFHDANIKGQRIQHTIADKSQEESSAGDSDIQILDLGKRNASLGDIGSCRGESKTAVEKQLSLLTSRSNDPIAPVKDIPRLAPVPKTSPNGFEIKEARYHI